MEDFRGIEKDFPNFKFNLALDRPDPEADAAGEKYTAGFVHNVLFENYLKNHEEPESCLYLMCGPPYREPPSMREHHTRTIRDDWSSRS